MPKTIIDYANTIIYKITCKDESINDAYVGHTTNFVQRKHAHKQSCTNEKSTNYNCKLYKTIRANGGWDNWLMEIVAFYKCYDHYEARIKEQEHFILLNATLNSIEPLPKPKEKPLQTNAIVDTDFKNPQKPTQYLCELCNFTSCNKKDYNRHISTDKHKLLTIPNGKKPVKPPLYNCVCGKSYKHSSSLCAHKNKCNLCINPEINYGINTLKINSEPTDKELIMLLIKENAEMKSMMMEVVKNISKHVLVEKEQEVAAL